MQTPVAIIVFNRPGPTRRVLAEIARARPESLYIIADGPRADRPDDAAKVAEVRALFDTIDWPCTVHRNFSDTNLGCRDRVHSGLDWVFAATEAAIILEDDCLPAPQFFTYCTDMLALYRDDERVFSVSGSNFARTVEAPGHYFSRYALMWGWATWRDRWARYVVEPRDASEVVRRTWWHRPATLAYWHKIFDRLVADAIDTWDYQWILTLWRHDALCCRPTVNLVENIGFGEDASRTLATSGPLTALPIYRGGDSFGHRIGEFAADAARDRVDERAWLQLGTKTLTAMYVPGLGKVRRLFRR